MCFHAGSYSSIKTKALTGRHKSLLPGCCPVFVSCVSTAHLYVCELVWLLSDRRNYLCSSCHIDGGSPVELCGVDTYAFLPHCTCSFCALNTQILYTCSCSHSLPYSHFSFYLFLMLTCTHCPPPRRTLIHSKTHSSHTHINTSLNPPSPSFPCLPLCLWAAWVGVVWRS